MSRFRVLAAGMAVAVLAVLSAAVPASAHDELLSSSPRAGEAVPSTPESVSLVFSSYVMTMGAVIVIADESGADWISGDLTITGTTVTAGVLPDMPEAGYELRWRVVSADGHPIAGIVPFTVGNGEPFTRESATDSTDAAASVDEDGDAAGAQSQITAESGVLRVALLGVGGAVASIAVFALIRFLLRRRDVPAGSGTPGP